MSDRNDEVRPSAPTKVSPLPTSLARHLDLVNQVLKKSDAELSDHEAADLVSECGFDDVGRSEAHPSQHEAIESSRHHDGSDAIFEALIGVGLMLVGLATMVAVEFLPRKGLTPIFFGAGWVFLGGGAWRLDKAIRSRKIARRETTSRERRN